MLFTTLASTLALAASAFAAAPSVTYPHDGTTWENSWYHNVTWTPQSGTGMIQLSRNGQISQLKSNVDLTSGRTIVQVPGGVAHATDYIVQIVAGGDTSSSAKFAIGDHKPAGSAASSIATGVATAASSAASGATSGAASALSSISASAASAASSVLSSAASGSQSASSAVGSIDSSASSALNSASQSLVSESASLLSSLGAAQSSVQSSITGAAASAKSSATSPAGTSSASSGAAPLGMSVFGVAVAAGLVAISTLSGALVL